MKATPLILLAASLGWQGLVREGKQALARQDLEQALQLFEKAVEADPRNGEAHFLLAQLHALQGREREAIGHYDEALRLLPQADSVRRRYGGWLLHAGYFQEAARVLEPLASASSALPDDWLQLGLAHYRSGHPALAVEAYRKALDLDAERARGHYLAGVALRSMGDREAAERHLERGLSLKPDDPELIYQMAELLLESGRAKESMAYWNRLPESDIRRHYGLGRSQLRLGDFDGAEAALRQAVESDPRHPGAHYQLGLLCARTGRGEEAEGHFRRFRMLEKQQREEARVRESKEVVRDP